VARRLIGQSSTSGTAVRLRELTLCFFCSFFYAVWIDCVGALFKVLAPLWRGG